MTIIAVAGSYDETGIGDALHLLENPLREDTSGDPPLIAPQVPKEALLSPVRLSGFELLADQAPPQEPQSGARFLSTNPQALG
jgi:hypothetical protein